MDKNKPTDGDIDMIGVLTDYDREHGHPEGWTRAVIDKINDDKINWNPSSTPGNNSNTGTFNIEDYTPEEQAAYRFYLEEVIAPDKWRALVEAWEADPMSGITVPTIEDFKFVRPESGFEPPGMTEYSGGDNKDHNLAVSVEALEYFARQLDQIAENDGSGMALTAAKQLNGFELLPGKFAKAEALRVKVVGSDSKAGIRGDSIKMLKTVHDALYQIKQNIRTLIREYDNTEEFNKLTTQQLNEVMGTAWGRIDDIKKYGQTTTEGA